MACSRMPFRSFTALAVLVLVIPAAAARASSDAHVALAYGLQALHAGDHSTAIAELTEASRLDPEDGTAFYFLGLALLGAGEGDRAAASFEAALRAKTPAAVAQRRIEDDLRRARDLVSGGVIQELFPAPELLLFTEKVRGEKHRALTGHLGVSAGNDSNPALLADNAMYLDAAGQVVRKESDSVLGANFRLAWAPASKQGEGAGPFGITLEGSTARHGDQDFLDRDYGRVRAHLALKGSPAGYAFGPLGYSPTPVDGGGLYVLLQGAASSTRVDGESALRTTEAGGTAGFRAAASDSRIEVLYRDLSYSDDRSDGFRQSGDELTLGLAQTFYLGQENRYFKLAGSVGERDAGEALDADLLAASTTLAWTLTPRCFFRGTAEWRREEFQSPTSNPFNFVDQRPREDTIVWASGSLSFALTSRLLLTIGGGWSERDSNLALIDLDYDRTTADLTLTWIF